MEININIKNIENIKNPEGKIICLAGPTGCGKTRLGVLLAKKFDGEVISADSMQIYKGMAIGSAAPTEQETDGVRHYMIGVAEPYECWSAAKYVAAADVIIKDILDRNKTPILVGGTGLWMEAAVKGEIFAPGERNGEIRRELENRLQSEGIENLWAELSEVDPEAAARLRKSDVKRIIRALEVWRETGMTITEHDKISKSRPPKYQAIWLGLRYRDREEQRKAIDRRVDEMIQAGLLDEVRELVKKAPPGATALQAIGYKELIPVLSGEKTLESGIEEIKIHTRQYAKRQLTWFRRNQDIRWIEWDKNNNNFLNFPEALRISTEIITGAGVCYEQRAKIRETRPLLEPYGDGT